MLENRALIQNYSRSKARVCPHCPERHSSSVTSSTSLSTAAAAVVNAGGALTRLSVEDPSLDAIYNRYFQDQGARNEAA